MPNISQNTEIAEFQSDDGSLLTNPSETPLNIREELLLVSARGSISAKAVQQKLGGGGRGGSYDGGCNGRSKYSKNTVADETLAAKRKGTRNSGNAVRKTEVAVCLLALSFQMPT